MHTLVLHSVIELTVAGGVDLRLWPFGGGWRHKSGAHLADSAQCQLSDADRADLSCVFGGEHIRWPRFLKRNPAIAGPPMPPGGMGGMDY